MRWSGHEAGMGEMINAYKILVGNPEGKRLFGRPRCKWKDSIRMDIKDIWWEIADWFIWLRTGTSGRFL
jgi:hypothetical protein